MIKVIVKKDFLQVTGHALYDEWGKDIVCASVSSMVITTVNAMIRLEQEIIYTEENGIEIKILKHSKIVDELMNNLLDLLKQLEQKYPNNIKIRRC